MRCIILLLIILASCTTGPLLDPKIPDQPPEPELQTVCANSGGTWEDAPPMICSHDQRGDEIYCLWQQWCRCPVNKQFDEEDGCVYLKHECVDEVDCRPPFTFEERALCTGSYHDFLKEDCGTVFTFEQ
ncbi:MAG: hypothetical protein ABIH34_04760 [Nanoarchaeota archaeon]